MHPSAAVAAWYGIDIADRRSGEQRLYMAVLSQAALDALKPLGAASGNTTVLDIRAARGFFVDAERFPDLAGVVEAAGLPCGAAHELRAWALDLDSRGWQLTPEEAKRLTDSGGHKGRPRKVA